MPRPKDTSNIVSSFFQNGRMHTVRRVMIVCARCTGEREVHMTTKAPKYCIECVGIVEKEKRKADYQREKNRKAAPKKKRKIPYAGWDPKERST